MSRPVISVVIPVSDKAPHIGAALESVLAQDEAPHEILVIDDASRDGSRAVVEGYPHPRIRLLSRTARGPGGYAARNLGIREAQGDWIAFLDADDRWYPQHLGVLAGLMAVAAPDVVCVFSGWERLWPDGRRQRDVFSASREPALRETALDFDGFLAAWVRLGASPLWTSAGAIRREALLAAGLFPEGRCRKGGDVDTWLRVMARGRALAHSEVTAAYCQGTANQVTRQEPRQATHCTWATLDMLMQGAPERRRRLLVELKTVTADADFRLRAAMARYSPVAGDRLPPPLRWVRQAVLDTLVRLPVPAQRSLREGERWVRHVRRWWARLLLLIPLLAACAAPSGPVERVTIPKGATFAAASDSLAAHGLIRWRPWFAVAARLGRYDRAIKPGIYEFVPGTSALGILRDLREGKYLSIKVTIPEGFTLIDIAARLADSLRVAPESVLAIARDPAVRKAYQVEAPSMEGYLAPDTYTLPAHYSAREAVEAMAAQFRSGWTEDLAARAEAQGLTRHQVVTLASIVEGEAAVEEERAVIAAVYRNRLRRRMPLQADPTVQYGIQLATGARKPRLFNRDYRFPSPYNTYLFAGLPPGPVGAPSRASIEAVLAPADVPYLYFVGTGNGNHVFTKTYSEHLRAIARLRR